MLLVPARLSMPVQETTPTEGENQSESEIIAALGSYSTSARKIGVLLADDHPVVSDGLTRLLNEQPDIQVVGQAGDGEAAINLARQLKPERGAHGHQSSPGQWFRCNAAIVTECPDIRVIGLSMHESLTWQIRCSKLELLPTSQRVGRSKA